MFLLSHGSARAALQAAQVAPAITVAHGSSLTALQLQQIHTIAFQSPTLNQEIMSLLQTKIGEALCLSSQGRAKAGADAPAGQADDRGGP